MTTARLDGRRAWIVALLLALSQVINYFDKNVMGLAAPAIMAELGLTTRQYGLIASSFFSFYALSGILVGLFVAHRVRSKPLLAALVLVWSLAQLPIVLVPTLGVLLVSRVLLGIGEGPASASCTSAVHEWFSDSNRNMPTALLMFGSSMGSVIAGPLLSQVMIAYGWRAGFMLCSALGIAWLLAWLAFGETGPGSAVGAPRPATPAVRERSIWRDPTILASIVTGFCAYWVVGFAVAWLAPLIRLGLGYDAVATGWLVSAVSVANAVAILAISYLSQRLLKRGVPSRIARGQLNGLCMLVSAGAFVAAAVVATPALKLVLLAIGGALPLVTFTLGPAIVSEIAPPAERSRLLTTIYAGITIAGFFSPIVAGQLIGDAGLDGYDRALLFNAVVVAAGGIAAALFLRPGREDDVRADHAPPAR